MLTLTMDCIELWKMLEKMEDSFLKLRNRVYKIVFLNLLK